MGGASVSCSFSWYIISFTMFAHVATSFVDDAPGRATAYMDELLQDYSVAQKQLVGNISKVNGIAVVYMCYNRFEIIRRALPAVMRSEGVEQLDLFISQDGGSDYKIDGDLHFPESSKVTYIRHRENLCTGLHHHFVKTFIFDIMGYDGIIIVEEDAIIHPQALQLLSSMLKLSVEQPDVGIVSLMDLDNSGFMDASLFGEGVIPVNGTIGHLWVYGFHRSRYISVRSDLEDYYHTIKGSDYRKKHHPPLSDKIRALMIAKGFPINSALSQDRYFINALIKHGFRRRYQTLFRFFEPTGFMGLHYRHTEAQFLAIFGRGMFNGRIRPHEVFDITRDPANLGVIWEGVRERINRVWLQYFPKPAHESLINSTFHSIMEGRHNGVHALANFRKAGKGYLARKQVGRESS